MSDNMELLEQRVNKQRQKLEQASTVVQLTQERFDAASAAKDDAARERKRLKSALKLAQSRTKRLGRDAKKARKLAYALGQDRTDAKNELAESLEAQRAREGKLAKAEAALAAARATHDVEQSVASTTARSPGKRATPATKKVGTPRKRATATKKAATPRKRTAAKGTAAKRAGGRSTA